MRYTQKIIIAIQVMLSIFVGLISVLLSLLFKFKEISNIFTISTISTFIAFGLVYNVVKKAIVKNFRKSININQFFDQE